MDSLLYQIFAGKRLNLDRFAVPKEYYPIVSRYLDRAVCLSKWRSKVFSPTWTHFGGFWEWIVPSFPEGTAGVTLCLPSACSMGRRCSVI